MIPGKKKLPLGVLMGVLILVLILAYYAAAAAAPGITVFEWYPRFQKVLKDPFHLYFNEFTTKFMVIFFAVYILWALVYITGQKNLMPGKEMGSAHFEDPARVSRRLSDPNRSLTDVANIVIYKRKKKTAEKKRKNKKRK